jgi:hypothetical protein
MRTSLTRLVAGTAIAATALLGVAGTANASTTTTLKPSELSIVAAKSAITVGQSDTIGGTLTSGKTVLPGRIIQLDAWNSKTKKWYGVERKLTGKHGSVDFGVRPLHTTAYDLVFGGGSEHAASHSAVAWVTVKPFVKTATKLSIVESKLTVKPKGADTISGTLAKSSDGKALSYQWVWLAWVGPKGQAHRVAAFKTGKYGKVSFTVHPAKTTSYELIYAGTKVLAATVSGVVTATVAS